MNASWRGGRRARAALAVVAVVAGSACYFAGSANAAPSVPMMTMVVTPDLAVSGDRLTLVAEITDCDNPGFDVPAQSVVRLNHGGSEVARSTLEWTQPSPGHWSATVEMAVSALTVDPGGYGNWLAWTDVAYSAANPGRCGPLAAFVDFVLVAPTTKAPVIIEASTTTSTTAPTTTPTTIPTTIPTTTPVTTMPPFSNPPAYTGALVSTTAVEATAIPTTLISNTVATIGETTITTITTTSTTIAVNGAVNGAVNRVLVANAGVANPGPADVLAFTGSTTSGSTGLALLLVGVGVALVTIGRVTLTRRSSAGPRTQP